MGRREQQLGANEALFREVNETVAESSTKAVDEPMLFLCECADEFCTESLSLDREQYEQVRAVPRAIHRHAGTLSCRRRAHRRPVRDYWVVEKFGEQARSPRRQTLDRNRRDEVS